MDGSLLFVIIYNLAVVFLVAPALTCLVETPIVCKALKYKNVPYICAINVITNVIFGAGLLMLNIYAKDAVLVYELLGEILVIPVAEALLLNLQTHRLKACFFTSYLSNAASFTIGFIVGKIVLAILT